MGWRREKQGILGYFYDVRRAYEKMREIDGEEETETLNILCAGLVLCRLFVFRPSKYMYGIPKSVST